MAIGSIWGVDLTVAAISAGLTAWVLALYLRRAADLKSRFSLGLVLLSGVFFAESLASVGVDYSFSARYSVDVALPLLTLNLLGLVGFAVLVWIARQ